MKKIRKTSGLDQLGPIKNHGAIREVFVERQELAPRNAGRSKSIKERQNHSNKMRSKKTEGWMKILRDTFSK